MYKFKCSCSSFIDFDDEMPEISFDRDYFPIIAFSLIEK